jgi:hypothetical protein
VPAALFSSAVGVVRGQLQLPAGTMVAQVRYTLSGTNGFSSSGSQSVAANQVPAFQIPDVSAPARYTLDVTATSADKSEVCTSSALFDAVMNRQTLVVLIAQCAAN